MTHNSICEPHWSDLIRDELNYPRLTALLTDEIYGIAHSEGTDEAKKRKIARLIDELWVPKSPPSEIQIPTPEDLYPIPTFTLPVIPIQPITCQPL